MFDKHTEFRELDSVYKCKVFRQFLSERKIYLQREVNKFVREQEWIKAYGELAKLDDIDKMMSLMEKKITDIRREINV